MACLRVDPATGALTYSRAGHLPPLVIGADGAAGWLDEGRGPVLGLLDRPSRPEATTTLAAGATLLLFTDGLVERRDEDLDVGLQRLSTVAASRSGAPLDALVDGLLADLVDVGATADDIALVAVRRDGRP